MTRRALITGGAGFIGSTLTDLLVDREWEVLVLDDLSSGAMDNLAGARQRGSVSIHVTDIRAPEVAELAERFQPEVVYHLAANAKVSVSVEDPMHDAEVNVLGTLNVLEAARAAGARKVVFAASAAIFGSGAKLPITEKTPRLPDSPYGVSKKIVADYFRWYHETHGVEYTLLTLANVYGPRQDPGLEGGVVAIFARSMLDDRRPTIFGDGAQTRDFVYVEDVADAFARAADAGSGETLNIGSGRETSVLGLYQTLADLIDYPVRADFAPARPGDIVRSVLNASRAAKVLGWQAWTPLEDGLRRTIDWYRSGG